MDPELREKRLRAYESNYGRDYGWYVEWDGKRLAKLVDPKWDDHGQFWHSYCLESLTEDEEEIKRLWSDDFWGQCPTIRSCEFDEVAVDAIAACNPVMRDGRIMLRGDYIYADGPTLWERLLLLLRRRRGSR